MPLWFLAFIVAWGAYASWERWKEDKALMLDGDSMGRTALRSFGTSIAAVIFLVLFIAVVGGVSGSVVNTLISQQDQHTFVVVLFAVLIGNWLSRRAP